MTGLTKTRCYFRFPLLAALGAPVFAETAQAARKTAAHPLPMARGPFAPTAEALKTYRTPDWFRRRQVRHLGVMGTPGGAPGGDWYARTCTFGDIPQYEHHVKHYGTLEDWLQGHHSALEGRTVRSRMR